MTQPPGRRSSHAVLCALVWVVLVMFDAPALGPASSSAQDVGVEVALRASPATVRARSAVFGAEKVDQHTADIDRDQIYVATLGPGLLALAIDGRIFLVDRGLGAPQGDGERIRDLIPTSLHLDLTRTSLPPLYTRALRHATISTTGSAGLCADVRRLDRQDGSTAGPCVEPPATPRRAGTKTHLLSAGTVQVHAVALDRTPCTSKYGGNWGLYRFDLGGFSLATDMAATRCARPPATTEPPPLAAVDALVSSLRTPDIPKRLLHLTAAVRPATLVATHRGLPADVDALRRLPGDLAATGMSRIPRVLNLVHRSDDRSVVALRLRTTATPGQRRETNRSPPA